MLESSQGKFYYITMWSPCYIRVESQIDYITIYDCEPEHKHIEGDYPYVNMGSQWVSKDHDVRLREGYVYFTYDNDDREDIVGHVKPKRVKDKLC